jgi:hypothetical protein
MHLVQAPQPSAAGKAVRWGKLLALLLRAEILLDWAGALVRAADLKMDNTMSGYGAHL